MVNKIFNDYLAKPFVNYLSEPFFNIIEPLPSLIDNFARSQIDPKKVAEWDAQRPEREALWKTVSNRIQLQSTVILDTNKMWNSFIEIWNPFIDMIEPLPSVINDYARSLVDPKKVAEWDAQQPEREAFWKDSLNKARQLPAIINKAWSGLIIIDDCIKKTGIEEDCIEKTEDSLRRQIDPKKVAEWDAERPKREAFWKDSLNILNKARRLLAITNDAWSARAVIGDCITKPGIEEDCIEKMDDYAKSQIDPKILMDPKKVAEWDAERPKREVVWKNGLNKARQLPAMINDAWSELTEIYDCIIKYGMEGCREKRDNKRQDCPDLAKVCPVPTTFCVIDKAENIFCVTDRGKSAFKAANLMNIMDSMNSEIIHQYVTKLLQEECPRLDLDYARFKGISLK